MRQRTLLNNIRGRGEKAFHAVNMALNARAFNIQYGIAIEFQIAAVITMDWYGRSHRQNGLCGEGLI